MFFRQRPADNATLSYFFGCAGQQKAVAVDVVAGDEAWFIEEARKADVQITHVIDTHVHADHVSGGPELARRVGARTGCTRAMRVVCTSLFNPCATASDSKPATSWWM